MVHSHKHVYIHEPCYDLCFVALQLITDRVIIQHHRRKTQIPFILKAHPMCSVKFMLKGKLGTLLPLDIFLDCAHVWCHWKAIPAAKWF